MEKYTKWRDRGSGIAPFLPLPYERSAVLAVALFCIRLPWLLLSVAIAIFLSWTPLSPLALRFIFFICGISIDVTNEKRTPMGSPDVIACNSTSPVDVLILSWLYRGSTFTQTFPSSPFVTTSTTLGAILATLSGPRRADADHAIPIQQIKEPVIVFPEATTSNGRAMLSLTPALTSIRAQARIQCVYIRYTPADITTPVAKSFLGFLYILLGTWRHEAQIRCSAIESVQDKALVTEKVGATLARLGRTRRVALAAHDKFAFLDAWTQNSS